MKIKKLQCCPMCEGTGLINTCDFIYKNLGIFVPSALTYEAIFNEVIAWANEHRLHFATPKLDVRGPEAHAQQPPLVYDWHYDGISYPPVPETLLMWSNQDPTEIRTREGDEVPCGPFEMLIINNRRCVHRRRNVPQDGRWFLKIINPQLY